MASHLAIILLNEPIIRSAMIRTAKLQDLPALLDLLQQLFDIEEDFRFDAKQQTNGLKLLLALPSAVVFVAETENGVVGMATGQLVISTAEGSQSLLVEDVVVNKIDQAKGFGSELLQALGEWGVKNNASRMQLLADKTNHRGIDFYLGRNWQKTQLICLRKYQH